jgi:hypothetical protein
MNLTAVTCHGEFDPQLVLSACYPWADLSDYFRELEELRVVALNRRHKRKRTYLHHICPQAQFPEYADEPANQIRLTIAEHVHVHDLLSIAVPELYVVPSFIAAAAFRTRAECCRAGRAAAAVNKANGTSVYDPRIQMKGASAGGKVSGRNNVESGQLARNRTPEHQRKASKRSNEVQKKKGLGFYNREFQRKCALAGSRAGNHEYWHVRRRIVNPHCELCRKEKAPKLEAA